jgi:excisionase family DNA binding protein
MAQPTITVLTPEPSVARPGIGITAIEPLQVTIREAGRLLSYDERTIRRLLQRGELRAVGQGRMRRIPMESLHDYQRRHLS